MSETTKEVAQLSYKAPSDVPFKDMASHCEALQIGKQQIMSNFMGTSLIEDSLSSCSQDSAQTQDMSPQSGLQPGGFTVSCSYKRDILILDLILQSFNWSVSVLKRGAYKKIIMLKNMDR